MNLTPGEFRALLASAILVLLSALGRFSLSPPPARPREQGLAAAAGDSALAVAESLYADAERRRQPLGPNERIDPNSAGEAEFDRLPGVGPALARAIVLQRRRNGPFGSLRDLERVPGLGSSKVSRLAPFLDLRADGSVRAPPMAGGAPDGTPRHGLLDLNRASRQQLQELPGIGPARADAILRWREQNGPFRNFRDLSEVPGIGPATVWKLRSLVVVRP